MYELKDYTLSMIESRFSLAVIRKTHERMIKKHDS